jgi:hypothetical protein
MLREPEDWEPYYAGSLRSRSCCGGIATAIAFGTTGIGRRSQLAVERLNSNLFEGDDSGEHVEPLSAGAVSAGSGGRLAGIRSR